MKKINFKDLPDLTLDEDTAVILVQELDYDPKTQENSKCHFKFSPYQYSGEIEYDDYRLTFLDIIQMDADGKWLKESGYEYDDYCDLYKELETDYVYDRDGKLKFRVDYQFNQDGSIMLASKHYR